MAETVEEKTSRITLELQQLLSEEIPDGDFSVGTVLYELVIKPAALSYATQELSIEEIRANLSLSLVLNQDEPDPDLTDNLLSNFNVFRREGTRATGLINIFSTSSQNVYIPQNALFTCAGIEISPDKGYVGISGDITTEDTDSQAYVQMLPVDANTFVFPISATTVEATDTVLSAGQVCSLTNVSSAFIQKAEIGSTFSGGSIEETTVELLDRASTGINAKVITGRDNIRSFLDTNTEVSVLDAAVFGMGDELLLRDKANAANISTGGHVDIYAKTNPVPSAVTTTIAGTRSGTVWTVEISSSLFPGAFGVTQVLHNGDIIDDLTHVLGFETSVGEPFMSEASHARYSKYQTMSITFESDLVDNTLSTTNFEVTVLYMPSIDTLQDHLNGVDVRSYAFDHIVKGAVPVIVQAHLEIEHPAGITPPSIEEIQQSIADIVNLKIIGTEALLSSDIVYGAKLVFPDGVVQMPINLFGRTFLPDGTQKYAFENNSLKVLEIEGLSPDNSVFACFPSGIAVKLTELS